MGETDGVHLGFEVEVVQGNALTYEGDILAIKDSPGSGGLDARVRKRLKEVGRPYEPDHTLKEGEYLLWPADQVARAKQLLIVGAPSVTELGYAQVRRLGRRFLESLWKAGSTVTHFVTTAHGINISLSLDEVETFRALLLGLSDAYQAGRYPATLRRITIVEHQRARAELFRNALRQFLQPAPAVEPAPQPAAPPAAPFAAPPIAPPAVEISAREKDRAREKKTEKEAQEKRKEESAPPGLPDADMLFSAGAEPAPEIARIAGPESFAPEFRKPTADESTPHVFVAMPFKDTYDDQFYLAIMPAVRGMGLLCERMDLDTFTGEITDRMFRRIETAKLMIALLDGANPNVYLEVGYAWGVRSPTVLIAHKEEPLPFDVRGHRVLIYDKIYLLKEMLEAELKRLLR